MGIKLTSKIELEFLSLYRPEGFESYTLDFDKGQIEGFGLEEGPRYWEGVAESSFKVVLKSWKTRRDDFLAKNLSDLTSSEVIPNFVDFSVTVELMDTVFPCRVTDSQQVVFFRGDEETPFVMDPEISNYFNDFIRRGKGEAASCLLSEYWIRLI